MIDDIRCAFRSLLARPGFSLVVVLTLALGIGANTAIYSLVRAVILRPLPFHEPDRLVYLFESTEPRPEPGNTLIVRPGTYFDWRAENTVFSSIGAMAPRRVTLNASTGVQLLWAHRVTAGWFETLGVAPLLGRTFMTGELESPDSRAVVIGFQMWQELGRDPGIVGRRISLDTIDHEVIGVMPRGFYPTAYAGADLWLPLYIDPAQRASRVDWLLQPMARLKPGVTVERARAEMDALGRRLARDHPDVGRELTAATIGADDELIAPHRRLLSLLLCAVAAVLAIAAVNVANLMLTRGIERRRELAMRAALGASRTRLGRQLLTESALLAALGVVPGILLAYGGVPPILALLPQASRMPRLDEVAVDGPVVGFAAILGVATGLLSGLVPVWHASGLDLTNGMKEGGRGASEGRAARQIGNALVVTEVALSCVLLAGATVVVTSFLRLARVDAGFTVNRLLTFQVRAPEGRYPDAQRQASLFRQLEQRVSALAGVTSVGLAAQLPFEQRANPWGFTKPGEVATAVTPLQSMSLQRVSSSYFRTLEMPLRAGRLLEGADLAGAPKVAVINESSARRYWPAGNPVGQSVTVDLTNAKHTVTIVGVVADARLTGLDRAVDAQMFWPLDQFVVPNVAVFVRGAADPMALVGPVRAELRRLDPTIPMLTPRTMEQVRDESLWQPRLSSILLGLFGALAMALAALGIYGVIAYRVSCRMRELSIRRILGSRRGGLVGMVLRQGLSLAAIGLAAGLIIAWMMVGWLASVLTAIEAHDPVTFAVPIGVVLIAATFACIVPAIRAASVDPAVALRAE